MPLAHTLILFAQTRRRSLGALYDHQVFGEAGGNGAGSVQESAMDKELPEETADSALTEHLVPLRETKHGATPQGRRIAALRRRFDRLHREGARLQERAAALGV